MALELQVWQFAIGVGALIVTAVGVMLAQMRWLDRKFDEVYRTVHAGDDEIKDALTAKAPVADVEALRQELNELRRQNGETQAHVARLEGSVVTHQALTEAFDRLREFIRVEHSRLRDEVSTSFHNLQGRVDRLHGERSAAE